MTDFVIDGKPYEPPESAAAEGYAKTPPATGAFGANVAEASSLLMLGRAVERGSQADSSALDQALYSAGNNPEVSGSSMGGPLPPPVESTELPPDEINSRFGPTGPDGKPVQITDRPMSADLGAIIGRQKTESMERDSVIARNEAVHSWPTNFATGMAAFMLDPLNQATAFVPGIGEETVLAGLGRVGMSGVAARMGARAITGATFGAAQQLPLVALRATLDPEEAVDYGWRDALRDVFYNAAFAAGMHAGIMGTGRELGFFRPDAIMGRPLGEPRAEMPPPAPGRAETAAVPDAAFAPERAAALHEAFEGAEPTDQVDLADHGFEPHEIAALDHAGLAFPDGTMVRGQWEAWEQERDARAPIEEKPPAVVQVAEPSKPVPEAADMPRSPMARRDAQSSAVAQVLNGEPVDIRPIVAAEEAVAPRDPMELRPPRSIADIITEEHLTGSERTVGRKAVEIRNAEIVEYAATQARLRAAGLPTTPADVAAKQREIQRNGTATGIPDGDLRAASEGLYAPKPVGEAPPKAAAVPRETQTKPVEGEAPAETAPPRLRTVSQIMQEDGVSAAKAAEKQLAEVLARGREVTPEDIAARKAALDARRAARQANAEVERVAADAGVDATGKAPEQVFAEAVDSLPAEQVVADVESHDEAMDAVLAEADRQTEEAAAAAPDAGIVVAATTEPIEEIEHDLQQTDRTPPVGEGEGGSEQPTVAAEHPEPVPAGGGPRPSGAGVEQRPGDEVAARRPAAGTPAGPVAAAAGPAAERGAEPVQVGRPIDGHGNPIFQKGERVVVPDGPLAGRHGEIIEATGIRFAPIFGGRATEANYHYQVRTDSGAITYASKLNLEAGEKPKAVPDPLWHGHPYDPEALKRLVDNNRANEQRALRAGARARTQTSKRSHADAAREARREGDAQQAVLDAWRAANPTEAEHALPEPERAPPPAPMAGGMALVESRHAKKGIPLFVVTMSERVPRERYDELSAGAKEGGGYYSSFKGHGAVPGFTFNDRAAAEAFLRRFGEPAVESKPAMAPPTGPRVFVNQVKAEDYLTPEELQAQTTKSVSPFAVGDQVVAKRGSGWPEGQKGEVTAVRPTAGGEGWRIVIRKAEGGHATVDPADFQAVDARPATGGAVEIEAPGWRDIGKNAQGETVSEDARGVRSVVRNGIRETEPVRMVPSPAGVQLTGRPLGEKGEEFLTAEEAAARPTDAQRFNRALEQRGIAWGPRGDSYKIVPAPFVEGAFLIEHTLEGNRITHGAPEGAVPWTLEQARDEATRRAYPAAREAAASPTPAEVAAQAGGGAPATAEDIRTVAQIMEQDGLSEGEAISAQQLEIARFITPEASRATRDLMNIGQRGLIEMAAGLIAHGEEPNAADWAHRTGASEEYIRNVILREAKQRAPRARDVADAIAPAEGKGPLPVTSAPISATGNITAADVIGFRRILEQDRVAARNNVGYRVAPDGATGNYVVDRNKAGHHSFLGRGENLSRDKAVDRAVAEAFGEFKPTPSISAIAERRAQEVAGAFRSGGSVAANALFKRYVESERWDSADTKGLQQRSLELMREAGWKGGKDEPAPPKEAAPAAAPRPPGAERPAGWGANNKLVTRADADAIRARLRAKAAQLRTGIDPEMMLDGARLAVFHIEAGARAFTDYAHEMLTDLGEEFRPYLRSWYESARHWPGIDARDMTAGAEIEAELTRTATAPTTEPITREEANRILDLHRGDPIIETIGNRIAEGHAADEIAEMPGVRFTAAEIAGLADAMEARGLIHEPEEAEEDELHGAVHPGDAGAGAEDVHGTAALGEAGAIRAGEGAGGGRPGGANAGAAAEGRPGPAEPGGQAGGRGNRPRPTAGVRAGRPAGEPGAAGRPAARPDDSVQGTNFTIEAGALEEGRGPKAKARDNLAAIRLAKQLTEESRPATRAEQEILAKYVGWGGLKGAFRGTDGRFGTGFEDIGEQLHDALTDEEYRTASRSTQYAHYTAEHVVRSMWEAVRRMGFAGGNVFEPGMGIGHFLGMMPTDLSAKSRYQGIEMDHLTASIAKLLYPQSGVRQADFIRTPIPEGTFDLVIGNPPFSDTVVAADPKYAARSFMLHDYFFAKSLDSVRPGGLLSFVTSAGTMNKLDSSAREYLAERADFVGGIRLNSSAFRRNAGTEVTTDILFFKRRPEGRVALPEGEKPAWTETTVRAFPNAEGTATEGNVSRYFSEHPENVLGQEGFFDKLYKDRYAVHALPGSDLAADLRDAVERLPEGVMTPPLSQEARAALDFASGQTKDGSFYAAPDGRLMQYRDGAGREVARRGKGATGGLTAAEHERVTGLIPVRDALRDVFAADLARDEALGAAARERLNQHYDGFVRKFGPINLTETRFQRPTIAQAEEARLREREEARYVGDPWDDGDFDPTAMLDRRAKISEIAKARDAARQAAAAAGRKFNEGTFDPEEMPDNAYERYPNVHKFMGDPESYRVRSIEDYNQTTGAASKKAIFHESILKHEQEPELKSANDGVLWSMNKLGRFDVDAIAEKMGRERADIIAELGDSVFKVPGTEDTYQTKDEYLSGDIVDKLEQARTAAEHDPDIRRNIEALEGAMTPPLPPSAISMVLGMPWIPTETVRGFVRDHLELGNPAIMHSDITGTWHVTEGRGNAPGAERWGTAKRDAYELLSDAMNRTPPRIYDQERGEDGKTVRVFNEVATQAAQDMVDKIKAEFTTWVAADEARADGLAQVYNDRLNRTVLRQYDGSYLTTPGVASDWHWRPHQTRVVARIVQSGNTYMAHSVGAGKTSAMIGSAMEMRRLGLVRKPLFVVPNHMLGQFTKEFYEQYPTARIAVADEERFHTSRRKQFVANVAQDDLDAIIMTHSSFGKIPISDEFQSGLIDEQIEDLRAAMEELDETSDRHTVGRIEHQIEALEQKLSGQGGGSKDQGLTFEELGADFLFTDEAHQFRKLSFGTKQGNLKGISPEGSDMAWDLYSKVRYLDSQRPGRSVVFASGTPITNTMGELYSLSRYLQRETLAKQGLSHFDSWAQTFGDTKTDLEETAAGTYQPVTRFQRFVNLPELYKMVGEVMDIVTPNQLEQYVVRPKLETGARQFHLAPRTPILDAYQAHLGQRMDAIKARKGPPKKGDDILLSVINDGRHAAIDPRFVAETQSDPRSKLNEMVKNIGRVWRDTADKQFYDPSTNFEKPSFRGPATQMVFMNLGVNGRGPMAFSAYQWVREALRREGIPANEIAFIGDYKGAVQRQKLFNDMNEGKVRVLVGSTQKMGTGVNVQRRLYAVHNLDPLWYPADDEQRVGRILRQGNHNPEIEVHDYSTKGTYDSAMWKMMGSKGRFIEQFYRGDPALRNMEDLGEASMFEQASAMSTTDERIITLTELKQSLDRARRRESAHQSEQYSLRQSLRTQESRAEDYTAHAAAVRRDIEQRHDTSGDNFTMQVGAEKFDKRGDAGVALDKAIRDRAAELGRSSDPVTVANIGGFRIAVERTAMDAVRVTLRLGSGWEPLSYKYLGSDESVKLLNAQRAADGQDPVRQNAVGTISSAETALRTLETRAALADRNAAEAHQRAENIRPLIGQRFEGTPEILHLAQAVHDLEAQLRGEAEAKKRAAAGEEEAAPAARPPPAPGEQAAAAPPDPEMEAAMQRLSDLQDDLEPEDRAAIADAGRATAEAEQKAAAIDEAANCLKGSA